MPAHSFSAPEKPHILRLVDWQNSSTELSLEALLKRYCTARPGLSAGAIEQLQVAVNLTREWIGHPISVAELFEEELLEQFVCWLVKTPFRGKPRSLATVNGRRSSLLTLWDFAFRKRLWPIPTPDTRDLAPLKVDDEDPVAWFPHEMELILEYAAKTKPNKWWTSDHWQTVLDCYWRSGERVQAMMLCRLSDLEIDVLCIRAEYTKDGKSGTLRIGAGLAHKMRTLARRDGCELIWDFPSNADTTKGLLKTMRNRYRQDILVPAKLPHDGDHLFHCIRRTSVTEVVNLVDEKAGQTHARHTTPKMTKKYISRAKLRKKTSTSDLLPSLIGPKQKRLF